MRIKRFIINRPFSSLLLEKYWDFKNRERKTSYGPENASKTYYVIGQTDLSCGLWWITNKVLMHLAYADEKGYIPIVDLLNYHTQYHNSDEIGKVNVWEKFYEQPADVNLDYISNSQNIIISDKRAAPAKKYLMGNTDFYTDPNRLNYFRILYHKYIKFSKPTLEYLEGVRLSIIPANARVLGVLCRGTDYLQKKPRNHPVQPDPSVVIEMVKHVLCDKCCEYVFLATEDNDILDLFRNEFGEKLLYINQKRISAEDMKDEIFVINISASRTNDRYTMGLEYLSATYILSKCNCFIGGRTGGTKGVLLMSDEFEYKYIFDLGLYK